MLAYNVIVKKENSFYKGFCREFPEVAGVGQNPVEAEENLKEMIYGELIHRIASRQIVPFPRQVAKRQRVIVFSMLVAAKVCLSNCMIKKNVQKTELAKKMNFHLPQISRLLDLDHATKIQTLEEALAKLGKRLTVGLTSIRDFES